MDNILKNIYKDKLNRRELSNSVEQCSFENDDQKYRAILLFFESEQDTTPLIKNIKSVPRFFINFPKRISTKILNYVTTKKQQESHVLLKKYYLEFFHCINLIWAKYLYDQS